MNPTAEEAREALDRLYRDGRGLKEHGADHDRVRAFIAAHAQPEAGERHALAAHLHKLIGEYWGYAYREGQENRVTDTPEGSAGRCLSEIQHTIRLLVTSPPPPAGTVTGMQKCPECNGRGEKCLAGCSAHDRNWYDCERCSGTGTVTEAHEAHASHQLRTSDASSFDFICERCGRTDATGAGWGKLKEPCPAGTEAREAEGRQGTATTRGRIQTQAKEAAETVSQLPGWLKDGLDRPAESAPAVTDGRLIRRYLNQDILSPLLDVSNGIDSPALAGMAGSAVIALSRVADYVAALTAERDGLAREVERLRAKLTKMREGSDYWYGRNHDAEVRAIAAEREAEGLRAGSMPTYLTVNGARYIRTDNIGEGS